MGVGRGVQILKFLAKKGCFLSYEWEENNFTIFAPPLEKYF